MSNNFWSKEWDVTFGSCNYFHTSHVLWDCPVYITLRNDFMCKLQELFEDRFEHFESLDGFEKASFVLSSELWEDEFSSMLDLVKDYIVGVWELRKARLEILSIPQTRCQNLSGELGDVGDCGRFRCLHCKVDTTISYVYMNFWLHSVFWLRGLPFECYYY